MLKHLLQTAFRLYFATKIESHSFYKFSMQSWSFWNIPWICFFLDVINQKNQNKEATSKESFTGRIFEDFLD